MCSNRLAEVPEAVMALTQLEVLHLQHNCISSLPPAISSLRSLSTLSLYANRISELPDEIGDLPALESLLLSNNRLTSLPSSIYRLTSLQDLAIDHNRLTSLPPGLPPAALASEAPTAGATALTGWASLNTLDASYNRLRTLPDGFGTRTLPSLQSLFLSGNRLRWLPVGVLFTFIPGLELFELRHNPIVQGQPYADDSDDDDENTEEGAEQAVAEGDEDGVIDPEVVGDYDRYSDESVVEGVSYAVPALVDLCCCVVATDERLLLSAGASKSDQGEGPSHLQPQLPQDLRLRLCRGGRSCVHCGQLFYGLPPVTAVLRRLVLPSCGRFVPSMGDSAVSRDLRLVFRSSFCSAACCRARLS